jgi:hypothetical protein
MENNEIKIILSERDKELANVGTFKYRFIGIRKNGKLLKYSAKRTKQQRRTHFRAQSCGFWIFFFGSYCLIATVLNRVTKKINRAQSGSSPISYNICLIIFFFLFNLIIKKLL